LPRTTVEWHTIDDLHQTVDTGKPVLLYFYASWCGWCKKLNKSVFEDAKVIKILNDSYFVIKVDVDKEPRLGIVAGVQALPTVILMQPIVSKGDGTTNLGDATYSDKSEVIAGYDPDTLKSKLSEFLSSFR
jgi:thiol-disulfide isomerase/thioredoxin